MIIYESQGVPPFATTILESASSIALGSALVPNLGLLLRNESTNCSNQRISQLTPSRQPPSQGHPTLARWEQTTSNVARAISMSYRVNG